METEVSSGSFLNILRGTGLTIRAFLTTFDDCSVSVKEKSSVIFFFLANWENVENLVLLLAPVRGFVVTILTTIVFSGDSMGGETICILPLFKNIIEES